MQLHNTSAYAFYITPTNHPIKRRVADVEKESLAKKEALLEARRLVLVLDLDQTVLHAAILPTYDGSLDAEMDPKLESVFAFELSDRSRMVVKFRPGLKEFLLSAHELYEIHVYTMANAEYAAKIVDLINNQILADLDPIERAQIIGGRIITRSHTEDSHEIQLKQQGGAAYALKLREKRKDIKHIVGDSSIAVILDDSDGVWADYLDHLIQLFPFVYWPHQEDLNKTFHARQAIASPGPVKASNNANSASNASNTSSSHSSTNPIPSISEPINAKKRKSPAVAAEDGPSDPKRSKNVESESTQSHSEKYNGSIDSNSTKEAAEKENEEEKKSETHTSQSPSDISASSVSNNNNGSQSHEKDCMADSNASGSEGEDKQKSDATKEESTSTTQKSQTNNDDTNSSNGKNAANNNNGSTHAHVEEIQTLMLKPFEMRYLPASDADSVLSSMMNVLRRLHAEFFALPATSKRRQVQQILPRIRHQVLQGRTISLSGVFPHQPKRQIVVKTPTSANGSSMVVADEKEHENNPAWREHTRVAQREVSRIVAFGAQYVEEMSKGNPERVTHMVTARGSTQKARNALLEKSVYLVTKSWLDQSIIHWVAQDEVPFKVPELPLYRDPKPPLIYPKISIWTQEDEDSDKNQATPRSPLSDSALDLHALLGGEDGFDFHSDTEGE